MEQLNHNQSQQQSKQAETVTLSARTLDSNINDLLCVYDTLNDITSLFATIKQLDSIDKAKALANLAQLNTETNADFMRHTINWLNSEMEKTSRGRVGGVL